LTFKSFEQRGIGRTYVSKTSSGSPFYANFIPHCSLAHMLIRYGYDYFNTVLNAWREEWKMTTSKIEFLCIGISLPSRIQLPEAIRRFDPCLNNAEPQRHSSQTHVTSQYQILN
jgi:hypothetical protein